MAKSIVDILHEFASALGMHHLHDDIDQVAESAGQAAEKDVESDVKEATEGNETDATA